MTKLKTVEAVYIQYNLMKEIKKGFEKLNTISFVQGCFKKNKVKKDRL